MIPLVTFDTETTGVDPETARIVSAALILLDENGQPAVTDQWLLNPGVEIPEGATAIHGITTERAIAEGLPAADGILSIAECLAAYAAAGYPLVVFNAPYDLTLLDREIRRHEVGIVGDIDGVGGIWWELGPVIDPLVIDKAVDRYRKGKRTLTALAAHMAGIEFEGEAHGAVADATTAGRIAQRMLNHQTLHGRELATIHESQVGWAREQAAGLADYFARQGNHQAALGVTGDWPYRGVGE